MKRIIVTVLTFIAVMTLVSHFSFDVYAEEANAEPEGIDEISGQVDEILSDYNIYFSLDDVDEISLEGIGNIIKEALMTRITAPFHLLGIIIIIAIFSAFTENLCSTTLGKNGDGMFRLIYTLISVAVLSKPLLECFERSAAIMETGGQFMLVFIPVFAGLSLFTGGITTIGAYNMITLTAAEFMVEIAKNVYIPILSMTMVLSVISSIYENNSLEMVINTARKIIVWTFTIMATLLTGFLTMKATVSASADTFATKSAKFMITGFVPVIGSAVSDAYTTVKGSLSVMKCTTGFAGAAAVILIVLPPIIELAVYRIVLWIGTAIAEIFSVKPLGKLLKGIDGGVSIAISIMTAFSLIFIISTAIIMKAE